MSISIVEFSVENFKIFKEKVTFSMAARNSDHAFNIGKQKLLKTSLVYGPNASGKSTLLDALEILQKEILISATKSEDLKLPHSPFLFSNKENKPTFFELVFFVDNELFRYNFSITKNEILTENLLKILSTGEERNCIIRKKQNIKLFRGFKNSEDVKLKTRKEVLFLSAAAQWNNNLAIKITEGFKSLNIISGCESDRYENYTVKLLNDDKSKKSKIIEYLQKADFNINDVEIKEIELSEQIREKMKLLNPEQKTPKTMTTIFFVHNKFDIKGNKIGTTKLNEYNESKGTQSFFKILGPIIDTLENGKVLFIDEFDNSLHPSLTKFIIDLFEKQNPNNAQLIVTTHDTNLLSYKKEFIKDQFWFTEKNKCGAGKLFSLAEFKMRNDTEYSKKYLEGRFGALPFIDSL